jgi:hypothetical protein
MPGLRLSGMIQIPNLGKSVFSGGGITSPSAAGLVGTLT